MAVKRKQAAPQGAPEWCLTYGDMVTNLLVFFVLLVAMSEVKKDEKFVEFMQAIQEAFGYVGGVRHIPTEEVEMPRNVNFAEMLIVPIDSEEFSKSKQRGVQGTEDQVTSIRRAEQFETGGKIYFRSLSAELDENAAKAIEDFAEKLRGFQTQVTVRGHCSKRPVADTEFEDHFDLAFARVTAVKRALIAAGIEPERLLLVSAGPNETFTQAAYTAAELHENDVVELLQIDRRVDEFTAPPTSAPTTAP